MKTSFIFILLFFFTLHFFAPLMYILFTGEFTHTYSLLNDNIASIKAFLLNFITLFGAIGIIYFTPINNIKINPRVNSSIPSLLFYFSIFYGVFFVLFTGGFSAALAGENHGSFMNYLNMFCNSTVLLIATLYLQKKSVNIIGYFLLFILGSTMMGSRSSILVVFLVCLMGFSFLNFEKYKPAIKKSIKYFVILGPILFGISTQIRGAEFFRWEELIKHLFERLNMIESSMIPIHAYDHAQFDTALFYSKYNFIHQMKLSFDAVFPGNIFEFDIYPNNYYRAIFLEYPIRFIEENYMSINLTLPVYFYMYIGYWTIPFSISIIVSLYFASIYFRNSPFIIILILSLVYELLYFFDWVMIFNKFYVTGLTLIMLKLVVIIHEQIVLISKKS